MNDVVKACVASTVLAMSLLLYLHMHTMHMHVRLVCQYNADSFVRCGRSSDELLSLLYGGAAVTSRFNFQIRHASPLTKLGFLRRLFSFFLLDRYSSRYI